MIASSLEYLVKEMNAIYEGTNPSVGVPFVVLKNVAPVNNEPEMGEGNVYLTLVNIEEEKTLKNGPIYAQKNGGISKQNPTIYLNLYLLFSSTEAPYSKDIDNISKLIYILQSKQVFTPENSLIGASFPVNVEKIILDLFTLNFEQLNHLWGILGGKYQPSVLYKARLFAVQASNLGPVATIEEIASNSNAN